MHPRLAINSLSTAGWTLEQDIELYAKLGVTAVSLYYEKFEAVGVEHALKLVQSADLSTVTLFTRGMTLYQPELWPEERTRLLQAVECAVTLGAPCLLVSTGSIGSLTWEEGVGALEQALGPVVDAARAGGVTVAIEQTLPVRVEIGFIHSFRDIVDVARQLGLGAVLEANYCWNERGIEETIRTSTDVLATVQLDDLVPPSTIVPDRAVPGDGVIQLDRLIRQCVSAGYAGPFELEVLGPRIEHEGYESVLRRSIAVLDELLEAAGA